MRRDLGDIGVADGFADRYNAAAAASWWCVRGHPRVCLLFSVRHTFASQSSMLAPSAPDQNRDKRTTDCAMIS